METTQENIRVVLLPKEEIVSFEGNVSINSVERLLEEAFKVEPFVCIQGEDRIYHRSEYNELVNHIEELNKIKK